MGKGSFFIGQPIFNQLLNYIPRSLVHQSARELQTDRYYKSFKTYDHLVTMLYGILNQCTSLREVTTGLLAWEQRIHHLGITSHPRRSTIADANKKRDAGVFGQIYYGLLDRYKHVLPDSRRKARKKDFYIFDSTCITLFQQILKGSGVSKDNGRRKGGIKVHTLLHAGMDVPTMICYSPGADGDVKFLKELRLPEGSVVVFDKGYQDYATYNRFSKENITWVSRHKNNSICSVKAQLQVNDHQRKQGIEYDWLIELGRHYTNKAIKVNARMVGYTDPDSGKHFQFITNNTRLAPMTIAGYYRKRWQIETFFKRIKQNYPLQYFLGDNENAIKIQIWCALIADLLLKIIKQGCRSPMAFSNIASLIRLHLMTYMDLKHFLRSPEKSLLHKIRQQRKTIPILSLFPT